MKLHIASLPEDNASDVTGWSIEIQGNGSLVVDETWLHAEEIFAPGRRIVLPPRVASLAMDWLRNPTGATT